MSFNVFVLNNDLNKTSKLNLINFYQSIEYFYNNNDGTKIITINEDLTYKYSAKHLVNILCNISLTSLNSYNKSIRKIFNFKYNNPIVLNKITLLVIGNINNYDTVFINYNNVYEIKSINEDKVLFKFYSNRELIINKSYDYIDKQIDKITNVKRYLK